MPSAERRSRRSVASRSTDRRARPAWSTIGRSRLPPARLGGVLHVQRSRPMVGLTSAAAAGQPARTARVVPTVRGLRMMGYNQGFAPA